MSENITEYSLCNYIKTTPNDPLRVSMKIAGLMLHVGYLLLVICYKQMRTKQLIFLNNLNIIAIVILVYGLYREFNICVTEISCAIEALGLFLSIGYYSYTTVLLVAYRMVCISTDKVLKILKWKFIFPFLISFYIAVFTLNLIIYVSTQNEITYIPRSSRCAVTTGDGSFVFASLIINNFLPSGIGLLGACWIIYKMKSDCLVIKPIESETQTRTSRRTNSYKQSALELSCQTIVFIVSFQIFTLTNLILIYNASQTIQFLKPTEVLSLRNFRWSAFIVDPIGFYAFNPLIRQSISRVWTFIKKNVF